MPGALLSSIFFSILNVLYCLIQFLQRVTFPSNCISCNSYSLIVTDGTDGTRNEGLLQTQ